MVKNISSHVLNGRPSENAHISDNFTTRTNVTWNKRTSVEQFAAKYIFQGLKLIPKSIYKSCRFQYIMEHAYTSFGGVSIKAGCQRSITAVYRRLWYLLPPSVWISLIKSKNDINNKNQIKQQRWPLKCHINSVLFDAQNAENRISELLNFKFLWGSMPPDPLRGKEQCGPLSGHSRPLHLQFLHIISNYLMRLSKIRRILQIKEGVIHRGRRHSIHEQDYVTIV